MKRIEIYLDNENRLALGIFDPADSEYEKYTLRGEDAYNFLKKVRKSKNH